MYVTVDTLAERRRHRRNHVRAVDLHGAGMDDRRRVPIASPDRTGPVTDQRSNSTPIIVTVGSYQTYCAIHC